MKNIFVLTLSVILATTFFACGAKQKNILETGESQVQLRSMQSRVYDTADRDRLLRTIIATLQDLGFVIDDADQDLGTVSGTKRSGYSLRMTVSIRPKGEHQSIVRSNAQYNLITVEDPEPYQAFFSSLSKALFLEAHLVDDTSAAGSSSGSGKTMTPAPKKAATPKTAPKSSAAPQTIPTAKAISAPQKTPDVASVPLKESVVRVSLRRQPAYISDELQIVNMLLEYDFFDSSKNPYGSFVNSFVDNNDGTITDKATGLMWHKGGTLYSLENKDAKKYIDQLNRQRFAGHSDWRLPNVEQLASLLEKDKINGVHLDPIFSNIQITCWTADEREITRPVYSGGWVVNFKQGQIVKASFLKFQTGGPSGSRYPSGQSNKSYVKAVRQAR